MAFGGQTDITMLVTPDVTAGLLLYNYGDHSPSGCMDFHKRV